MYQYTVFATIAKQEIELKTFFDDLDEKPMEKAKALVEANKGKFRSLRIEKRITPMLCHFVTGQPDTAALYYRCKDRE